MKLSTPIHPKYFIKQTYCLINQLFGMNQNSLFYGPEGHTGVDLKTIGTDYWDFKDGKMTRFKRDDWQEQGRIPITASHAGELSYILYDDKQKFGWGARITADVEKENGVEVQYRTLYWHIETPWRNLVHFFGSIQPLQMLKQLYTSERIRKGAIIAIGGNNGMSTGPHLHFALDKREMTGNGWTAWRRIDPMPLITAEEDIIYQYKINNTTSRFWFQGVEVSKEELNKIIKSNSYLSKKLV